MTNNRLVNPFQLELEEVERQLRIQLARDSYYHYVQYTNPEYIQSKFHEYLCNTIDSFIKTPTKHAFDILLVSVPPQHGKLIADDQPILTTSGWKTHGNLTTNDYVYSPQGTPTRVTHIHPKHYADIRVTFSNGEQILCHENHEWVVQDLDGTTSTVETKHLTNSSVLPPCPAFGDVPERTDIKVTSITKVTKQQGNCITVDGGVYLVGNTCIPTHNSLTITETLPSYLLGKKPNTNIILCGYNEDFAIKFGRRNKQKIEEFHHTLFPGCVPAQAPWSNVEFETTKKGRCISRGILSGITGNPAEYFIIDDPIKTSEEAESPTQRNKIIGEYLASVRTRIKPGGKLIVIQTRWHEEDLYGYLQKNEKGVTVLNIPCECDDPTNDPLGRKLGDALCPEIGRGNEWLSSFKEVYLTKEGNRVWTALYQGKPTIQEGNLLKREWWRYYTQDELPQNMQYTLLSVDAAFKGGDDNDYVAIQLWGKYNDKYYLLDRLKAHLDFVSTLAAVRDFKKRYPDILTILIEDKANGTAIINVLSQEIDGIVPIEPAGGKISRVNAVSSVIENGRVFLPRFASYTSEFVAECSAFPNAAHDDEVDSMSQALHQMIFVDADVVDERKIRYSYWREDMFEDYENASEKLQKELLELWGHPEQWRDDNE